jgi:hypothetical protein
MHNSHPRTVLRQFGIRLACRYSTGTDLWPPPLGRGVADAADSDRDETDAGTAEPPGRPGVANLVAALNVRRNAAVGFGVGVAFTLFVVYVYVIVPDRPYSLGLWLTLGFVLAVGTGLLLTAVLTLVSAVRTARELD